MMNKYNIIIIKEVKNMALTYREKCGPDEISFEETIEDANRFIVIMQGNVSLQFDVKKEDISVCVDYYNKVITIESERFKMVCPFNNILYYSIEYE